MNKTYAVIQDGVVINIIVANSLEIAEEVTQLSCVEFYVPKIGDGYLNNEFIPMAVPDEEASNQPES